MKLAEAAAKVLGGQAACQAAPVDSDEEEGDDPDAEVGVSPHPVASVSQNPDSNRDWNEG